MSVLVTIPFAVLGAYWSLYLTGTRMDSVGWIGIIILVGVVVNNGIVLVDNIARLRAEGLERARAILEGTAMRVRPVLMTATTSVIGLVPLATTGPWRVDWSSRPSSRSWPCRLRTRSSTTGRAPCARASRGPCAPRGRRRARPRPAADEARLPRLSPCG
jgi:hypothetical protein